MTLHEAEARLSELNVKLEELLKEREDVLKEWNVTFNTDNQANIICVDENTAGFHELYLVNGEFKKQVCHFSERDIKGSLDAFYKILDNSMRILNIANHRDFDSPDYQKNLIYAKAIEIRENCQRKIEEEM